MYPSVPGSLFQEIKKVTLITAGAIQVNKLNTISVGLMPPHIHHVKKKKEDPLFEVFTEAHTCTGPIQYILGLSVDSNI